jgi:hypothetical protein
MTCVSCKIEYLWSIFNITWPAHHVESNIAMGWSADPAALARIILVVPVLLSVAVEEDGRRGVGSNVHQLRADFSISNLVLLNINI